jgi:hypothetical protein
VPDCSVQGKKAFLYVASYQLFSNLPPPAPATMPSPRLPGHRRIAASALADIDSQTSAQHAAPVSVLVYGVLLSETNTGCGY